jgi:ornithine cyclodeaminase/alanine dehydrogenase-like protein (mu-crystallin family)
MLIFFFREILNKKSQHDSVKLVKNADVIVTVTPSSTPVLKKDWVKDGAHINGKT